VTTEQSVATASDFTAAFTVDRTPQEVYDAVVDVRSWWSQEVTGDTDRAGAEFVYRYQDVHRCRVRVTDLAPGRKVAWLVLDNHFSFVEDQQEWTGTQIVFDIVGTADGTELRFTHVGLAPRFECYDVCSNAWAGYLHGSLRSLITTGVGQPNPKEDGALPAHQAAASAHRQDRGAGLPAD
jgi:uncharacterized protein YndB with AHSA1/START domain